MEIANAMETFDALVRRIALLMGVQDIAGKDIVDLVWQIQVKEGNQACFRTKENCSQMNCLWREQCVFRWKQILIEPKGNEDGKRN